MLKDIFIDNCVAIEHFCNPIQEEYKGLIKWLLSENDNPDDDAVLVLSQKIIVEYKSSMASAKSSTSMPVIVDLLLKKGRINFFNKKQIQDFQNLKFKPRTIKRLRSNRKDWDHLSIVLLSNRKMALSYDNNLRFDINNFPGINGNAEDCPSKLGYK